MPPLSDRYDGADSRDGHALASQPETERQGDFRGHYGYGRPAHRSDPNARYGFDVNLGKGKQPN